MRKLLWVIGGIAVGTVLANFVAYVWEAVLLPMLPFGAPPAIDDVAQPGEQSASLIALLWIAAGWLLSTLIGAFAAFRISYWDFAGWAVAAVFAAMSIGYVLAGPFPMWFQLWAVAGPFIGALFGFGVYRRWRAAHLHLRSRRGN